MDGASQHTKGLAIVVLGVLILTPDTLLIRLIALDPWTLMVWRGLLQSAGLTVILLAVYRRATPGVFRAVGAWGLAAALLFALSTVLFIVALSLTAVANVLIITAASPFFAALLSRAFLGEPVARRTWAAIAAALCGIALLGLESLGRGALLGDLAALGAAFTLGAKFTVLRRARHVNMIPAMVLSGLIMAAIAALPAIGHTVGPALERGQVGYLLIMGLMVLPLATALMTLGPRYLPAPEVSLLLLLETVLGPLWVWLVIGEAPGLLALMGGAVVVAALAVHSALALAAQRQGQVRSAGAGGR